MGLPGKYSLAFLNDPEPDRVLYFITGKIVKTMLQQVTQHMEQDPLAAKNLVMLVVGGSALNAYLPPELVTANDLTTHDWDTRVVMLNQTLINDQDYLEWINRYRVRVMNFMLAYLNRSLKQIRNRAWFEARAPGVFAGPGGAIVDPAAQVEMEIAAWLEANVIKTSYDNFFILMNTRGDLQVTAKDLLTVQCQLVNFGWHSLLDNTMFFPSRPGSGHYSYFLTGIPETEVGGEHIETAIPYVQIDEIDYPTIGYLIWDTCRMIHKKTPKMEKYMRKFGVLLDFLDHEFEMGRCRPPRDYSLALGPRTTIGTVFRGLCQQLGQAMDQVEAAGTASINKQLLEQQVMTLNEKLIELGKLLSDPDFNMCLGSISHQMWE